MKVHLIALAVVGLISFFIGIFAAVAIVRETLQEEVYKGVMQAFDYYIEEHGYEEESNPEEGR